MSASRAPIRILRCEPCSCLDGKCRRRSKRGDRLLRSAPSSDEPGHARLVARRDQHAGARTQEREVGRDDRLGIVDQEPGRPERVVEPVPGLLERGRETAVDDPHGHPVPRPKRLVGNQ